MAQYPPSGPPQYPQGQGYPPPGQGYGPPPQGQPEYPPPQGYGPPPGGYGPPPYGEAPPQTARTRRGCGGCLIGCLVTFAIVAVIAVIMLAAGIFMFRQAFPTTESFAEATGCAGLRVAITVIEAGLNTSDMSADERAAAQTMLSEARTEFERNCGSLP